jgi:hypothetical protein
MDSHVDERTIIQYVRETFDGVDVVIGEEGIAAGDTFFIYDPDRNLEDKRRFPFATIVTKDYGDFDRASNLNRPGVFRLNVGISQGTFRSLFGPHVSDASAEYDYSALDQLLPHPVYGSQAWMCVLNPSAATFESVKPLLAEAYQLAVKRITSRNRAQTS